MRPGRHEATAGDAMDDDSRRTVRFYVGGEHAIESEGMWADETPAGTYLVKNIPFFAYQVSYQDEVAARWCDDGCLWALGVIANSGNVTLRATATASDRICAEADMARLSGELQDLGIGHEEAAHYHLLAINVSEVDDIWGLIRLLGRFERSGQGIWEESKVMPWWPHLDR